LLPGGLKVVVAADQESLGDARPNSQTRSRASANYRGDRSEPRWEFVVKEVDMRGIILLVSSRRVLSRAHMMHVVMDERGRWRGDET